MNYFAEHIKLNFPPLDNVKFSNFLLPFFRDNKPHNCSRTPSLPIFFVKRKIQLQEHVDISKWEKKILHNRSNATACLC